MTDIKSNAKSAIIYQALKEGKVKQFPKVDDVDLEMMRKKRRVYLSAFGE